MHKPKDKAIEKVKPKTPIKAPKSGNIHYIGIFTDLIARFGLKSVVASVILYAFIFYGTKAQHQEFIDRFILLKFEKNESTYLFFILILIVITFIVTIRFYRLRIKEKDERIKELQKEKTLLQNKLLK